MSQTAEHGIWRGMLIRCEYPKCEKWEYYGGRGISVCERWHTFTNFFADMGPRPSAQHSLDRIDVNGPYSPDNLQMGNA